MRHLQGFDSGHALHPAQHRLERGSVGLEIRGLLIEEHVLSRQHDFRRALASIHAHAFHDVLERKRAANFRGRSAELATASATARDLNHAEGRTVFDDRNLFDSRLHALRHFDDSFERWIAGHHALEQIAEDALDLAVDQVIDVEFIQPLGALKLPGAGTTDDDFWSILLDYRVRDDF